MENFQVFCEKVKLLIESYPQMNIEGARKIVQVINDFLYTTHDGIGSITTLGTRFTYFSEFHKFWHEHYKDILNCTIDEEICEKVADALHNVYVMTNGDAFKSVWNTYGLAKEDVCRVRFFTANQDFRGSRNFSELAEVYESDNSIFDTQNIYDAPANFLKDIKIGQLSQNDKREKYAQSIAKFLLNHGCTPFEVIDKYDRDIYKLRNAMIECNAGYGNKKADMFVRDMVVLGIWKDVTGFDKIDVASDVNTIKVALRTGIIKTEIPLVSSFLDIFCYQYGYIDYMNAKAWRKVWEIWNAKYPAENIESPCLLDYFVYNVIGKQFCKESLYIFKGKECGHIFRWHSAKNKTCQICFKGGNGRTPATAIKRVLPCCDEKGSVAILMTDYVKKLPADKKIDRCPLSEICADKKDRMPPKSISILGQTGWQSAYTKTGQGGGGLMA